MSEYQQPAKAMVRTRLLNGAVAALTSQRNESTIVRIDELKATVDYALGVLIPRYSPIEFRAELYREFNEWSEFHRTRVETRGANELRVLYLCGPEPLNDLKTLMSLGVDPHNVWAVTSSADDLNAAVAEVSAAKIPLKIHNGTLAEFFDVFPETFDIVYVDACGPFAAGKPNTLMPLLTILVEQRLTPLAVMITTFSEPPQAPPAGKKFAEVMTAFFRYRYRDLPKEAFEAGIDPEHDQHEPAALQEFIRTNTDLVYSEFITKLLVELAGYWIPSCRALSMKALFENYVAPRKQADQALAKATDPATDAKSIEEFVRSAGHAVLSPSSYPQLSFYNQLKQLRSGAPLASQLGNLKINGTQIEKLLSVASLLDNVFEGHWDCLNEKMKRAVALSWFDRQNHFSCDVPLPNLLINSLLGIYGRPWYVNPMQSIRLSYRAKTNTMYSDALILDQCRSFFDWWPTIDLCPSRFTSRTFQVLARCIIDRMNWHNWYVDGHPFRGGAVACRGAIDCAKPHDFAARETIVEPSSSVA